MSLNAEIDRAELELARPFTIARGTKMTTENVIVRLSDGEHTGIGAAAPAARYGETGDTVESVLPRLLDAVPDDPYDLQGARAAMAEVVGQNPAAKAAVDIALHDLAAKRLDIPLYRLLGLDPERTVTSSYTVGLDDTATMREKAAEAIDRGFSILKVKLGTDRDYAIVEAIREMAPEARIRVDANEAWTPKEAIQQCRALAELDVEFVEQPVSAADPEGLKHVHQRSPLPIAADESCVRLTDVPHVADRADIANLKLMKCGGIREAVRMAHAARAHGLEVMLGCMIETNAAIAAGMQLAPLVDYADLDGSMLLAEDPYAGIDAPGGVINLEGVERPGTGVQGQ